MDSIGNQTFFTILARWPGEVRLFTVESPLLQTETEVIEALEQNERAVLVFRHDPDVPRRDVSEDIARKWLEKLKTALDGVADPVPAFISQHIKADELEAA